MSFNLSKCPHLESEHYSHVDLKVLGEAKSCNECDYSGLNLWICLYQDCHFIGCSEQANDHSTEHFQIHQHSVHMNVSSQRVWCYFCERELYLNNRGRNSQDNLFSSSLSSFSNRVDESLTNDSIGSGTGLVGLQNIANTCYMNSALQALSNLIPMTYYFINCSDLVEHIVEQSAPRCKAAGLAKSYQRLMQEIWTNCGISRDIIAPRGILYGIRTVHPMFRGYQQHDTQEFLRCFMDQLHEELKEYDNLLICPKGKDQENDRKEDSNFEDSEDNLLDPFFVTPYDQSESEYDTCESSMSERSTPNPTEPEILVKAEYFLPAQRTFINSEATQSPQESPSQLQQPSRSIISEVFDGKLLSSVQCLTCDRISAREETFQDLSLPIPNRDFLNVLHQTHSLSVQSLNSVDVAASRSNEGWLSWMWNMLRSWFYGPSVTLYDCMASFFSADELKGDNMYSCDKCKKLRTGVKFSRVLNLPEVLCIHLKRFRHDLSYSSKIASHVYFPLDGFDMRPYLHKDCQSTVPTYNLSSVICHHGTVGGGHYTCYARNTMNGRWYEFDDQFVTEVTPETVQNCQAYVLFYQKYNPHMELVREEARNLSNSYPSQNSDIQFYISRDWLSKLATFAEPGPINNQDILCSHGGILPSKMQLITQISVPISQPVWDFLYRKFGGGPAISMLFECEICKRDAEMLTRRQFYELAVFTKYNGMQGELDSSAIYAIAMPWLRKWQQFSRGLTHKEPGPITNENIAAPAESGSSIRSIRVGSDYAQLNASLWRFLHDIYGGGPEILIRGSVSEQIEIVDQDENSDITNHIKEDVSDTESNIGHRKTPDLDESEPKIIEENCTNGKDVSPKLTLSLPSVKDPKFNRAFAINTKKIKMSGLQNTGLRKKTRKNRSAYNNADMLGTYKSNVGVTETLQSNEVTSTAIQDDSFQTETFHSQNTRADKVVEISSLHSKRKQREKEKVTLQKFVALRDPSEQNETDV